MSTTTRTTADTRYPPQRLRLRTLLAAVALVGGVIAVVALAIVTHQKLLPTTYPAGAVRQVTIDLGSGYAHVFATDRTDIEIVAVERAANLARPAHDVALVDDEVVISGDCEPGGLGLCEVSFQIEIPRDRAVTVDVRAERGVVTRGLRGDLTAETGHGDLVVQDHTGTRVDLITDDGAIRYVGGVTPHAVSARSDAGNVLLRVPEVGYRLDVTTASGNRQIRVPDDPDTDRSITVVTGSGNINVLPH